MKIFNWNLKDKLPIEDKSLVICLGAFETLHLGHYELFKNAFDYKKDHPEFKSAILVFKNPIKANNVIEKKAFQLKTRLYTLEALKFDYTFIVETNDEIKNISASNFVDALKLNNIKTVSCGLDYCFGFNKTGDIDLLKKNFEVLIASLKKVNKQKISSTLINELIGEGNVDVINKLLLEKYALIVNADHFKFAWPSKINKLKPGIYVVNAVIKNIEYHGLCLVLKFNENELDLNNILYLLDIETIPSKYDEIFIEFLGTIRYIEIQKDNKISNQDIDIAIGYFKTIQN